MQPSIISSQEPDFPDILRHLDRSVKSINILGALPKDRPVVALVGSAACTNYGARVAYTLAKELTHAGVTIMSGLGSGISAAAHRGALDAGGCPLAVLSHGFGRTYPARSATTAAEIVESNGALLSEYEVGTPPNYDRFKERCQIIGAWALITVVVEAQDRDLALRTAAEAAKAGRQILAVPGNITTLTSSGSNNIIRSGQGLAVTSATDIIIELGFLTPSHKRVAASSPDEASLIRVLKEGISTSHELIHKSGLSHTQFADVMSLMEITGKVRSLGAGRWAVRGQ
jgi:DNA processing protein